ncbi:MAG: efflux RND transporter periplasmic adaptor subunit [Anaerolineales bacterium]|nr:efflux RND transporter periplasmic adaptor subunit [Anaerolineales bacterium]
MKRWKWIAIILVVLVGGFFAIRQVRSANVNGQAAQYETVIAEKGALTAIVGATGVVEADQSADLVFETDGTVESVLVELGTVVEKDQILAVLVESSLSSQIILAQADLIDAQRALDNLMVTGLSRAQAQEALAQAMDALDRAEYSWQVQQKGYRANGEVIARAEANLVLAQNQVDRAQHEYSRVSNLPDDNSQRALARANLADARLNRDSILRSLNWYNGEPDEIEQALLDASVALSEAQLNQAEREFERWQDGVPEEEIIRIQAQIAAAQSLLDMTVVKAPFAGTITRVSVAQGDLASIGSPAFRVSDLEHQVIQVEISEVDINSIEVGQPVQLDFDAVLEKTYQGEVIEVGMEGVETQGVINFLVKVETLDTDERIRPGLTAAVNIIVNQLDNVLLVPNRAVRVVDGERVITILKDGILEQVPVILGASADQYSEVAGGELQVGDIIVLNPPTSFGPNHGGPFGG